MENINQVLELFNKLGINPLYVGVIVFITYLAKSFDKKNKFKQGYVLFPLLISLFLFSLNKKFEISKYVIDSCIHAAVGSYGYNLYSNFMKKKKKE
jgi:hypothetical protein